MPRTSALFLLLLTTPLIAQNAGSAGKVAQAANLIQPADLKADISFLASDDLAGRNAGSPEDHIATDYIASEFMRLGLKPMGDNGTYFQNMELVTANLDGEHTSLTATINGTERRYTLNQEFQWARQSLHPARVCGPIAFAGYGVSSPEYNYDALAGLDVKGKVVLVFMREPQANDPASKLMGTLDTYHAFYWHKIEALRKRGAAGVLVVQDRVPRDVKPIPPTAPRPSGGPSYALAGDMWDIPVFMIKRDIADQLLAPTGKTSDALQAEIDRTLQPHSFEVPQGSACLAKAFTGIKTRKGRNVI